ncbi:hypothetical protein [Desulfofustis phage LS06-2018-MD01]|jgi:hypothetical protein|nr:hypothetical protein [Desulfofustis phage LS06-2018-MD01]
MAKGKELEQEVVLITAKKAVGDEVREGKVSITLGKSLTDNVEMFGEELVLSAFMAEITRQAQSAIRTLLNRGLSAEKIAEELKDWKPGARLSRAPTTQSIISAMMKLEPEARENMIEELRAKLASGEAV